MIRFSVAGAALLALAACGTSMPNDVAEGVGFQDYREYQARRAALRGDDSPYVQIQRTSLPIAQAPVVRVAAPATPATTEAQIPSQSAVPASAAMPAAPATAAASALPVAQIAAAAIAQAELTRGLPEDLPSHVTAAPTGPTRAAASNPGISDEQEFSAVAARETIESDAERRARMQANRVEIAATALPGRPGDIGPNVIDFALSTDHGVGERRYQRTPFGQGRHERNCIAFRSADLAQEWFLANGGPGRDRRALDPDGDGFACAWDPAVYRSAAQAARD